jgi:hypothetical protein
MLYWSCLLGRSRVAILLKKVACEARRSREPERICQGLIQDHAEGPSTLAADVRNWACSLWPSVAVARTSLAPSRGKKSLDGEIHELLTNRNARRTRSFPTAQRLRLPVHGPRLRASPAGGRLAGRGWRRTHPSPLTPIEQAPLSEPGPGS